MTVENYVRTVAKSRMMRLPKNYNEGDIVLIEVIDDNEIHVKKAKVVPKLEE